MNFTITNSWFDSAGSGYWVAHVAGEPTEVPEGASVLTELFGERYPSNLIKFRNGLLEIEKGNVTAWEAGTEGVNLELQDNVIRLEHNYYDQKFVEIAIEELGRLLDWRLSHFETEQISDQNAVLEDTVVEFDIFDTPQEDD